MRKSVIAGLVLWAAFAAFAGKTCADVNYPWCIIGNTRAVDCYFSSREQCMQDGRNRGFGGQCIQNPYYKPGAPTVSGQVKKRTVPQTPRPSQVKRDSYDVCAKKALDLGFVAGQAGRYQYVCQCMGGSSTDCDRLH
jgi:hypothetical protein